MTTVWSLLDGPPASGCWRPSPKASNLSETLYLFLTGDLP
jgi:hypothetical protein